MVRVRVHPGGGGGGGPGGGGVPEALAPPLGRAPRAAWPGRCCEEHVIGIRVDMSLAMCFVGRHIMYGTMMS